MDYLEFELISPDRTLLKSKVWKVILPTSQGQITVLSKHIPLITKLIPGEVIIQKTQSAREYCVITGGFAEITGKKVRILADAAEHAQDIDEAKAEKAKRNAQKIIRETKNQVEFNEANAALERAIARLKVARKHKGSRHNF